MVQAARSIGRRPVRFGPDDRQMVGIHHFSQRQAQGDVAALLCNPFGQEAVRAHRVFAVLADRLARRGVPVLRFDYHGTGDSPGDDESAALDAWASDIGVADAMLAELAPSARRVWIGLRLGALLAARASASVPPGSAPEALVLWEPVVDGAAYLDELARADREARLGACSLDAARYARLAARPVPRVPDEALGFALPPALRDALLEVRGGEAWSGAQARRLACIVSGDAELPGLSGAARWQVHRVDARIDWATNDSGGTSIAPAEVVNLLVPLVLGDER